MWRGLRLRREIQFIHVAIHGAAARENTVAHTNSHGRFTRIDGDEHGVERFECRIDGSQPEPVAARGSRVLVKSTSPPPNSE